MRSRIGSAAGRTWDYIVLGAGAAGCVVAGRLSEMLPEARIALIEAGGERLGLTTRVPGIAFIASTFPGRTGTSRPSRSRPSNGRRLSLVSGARSRRLEQHQRHAVPARPLARIRPVGAARLPGLVVRPGAAILQKAETNTAAAPTNGTATSGPMSVKQSRLDLPICDAFLAAAGEAGTRSSTISTPISSRALAGSTPTSPTAAAPVRRCLCAAGKAAWQSRPSVGGCRGTDRHRSGRARGVEIIRQGVARDDLGGARNHPLCGGTVNSPQLLMLSGIGPADHLASIGIPVVLERPKVGRNLQNHRYYASLMPARSRSPRTNT